MFKLYLLNIINFFLASIFYNKPLGTKLNYFFFSNIFLMKLKLYRNVLKIIMNSLKLYSSHLSFYIRFEIVLT